MIKVRSGFFETNSSSCHKLIFPCNQEYRVPKILNLGYWETDGIKYLSEAIERNPDDWIPFLYASGVEEIKYNGYSKIKKLIESYKGTTEYNRLPYIADGQNLPAPIILMMLFGENTQYLPDEYDDEVLEDEKNPDNFVFTWR